MKNILHITNGNSLTNYLKELDIHGTFLTWQEMLCEGPTTTKIDSDAFKNKRRNFLSTFYDIEVNEDEYELELNKLNHTENYSDIVLWFEYDLFCHINMIAVISLIKQKQINLPIYLVCSGRVEGEQNLKSLSELTHEQLLQHYQDKIKLKPEDIEFANSLWKTYCGKDHNLFKLYILQKSSFEYMSNCLKAHLKRFPNLKNGLSTLEENILTIVKDNQIKSKHHLLGYALNYQGYYGFSDLQLNRLIENLSIFFNIKKDTISLNRKGHEALMKIRNFSAELKNHMSYGGVKRMDYQFSQKQNKLIKSNINAY